MFIFISQGMHIGYYRFPRMILLFASMFGGGLIMSALILGIDSYSSMVSKQPWSFFEWSAVTLVTDYLAEPSCFV